MVFGGAGTRGRGDAGGVVGGCDAARGMQKIAGKGVSTYGGNGVSVIVCWRKERGREGPVPAKAHALYAYY
jgi:hypothetical protein